MRDARLKATLAFVERRPLGRRQRAIAGRLRKDANVIDALERQCRVVDALQAGGPVPSPDLAARLSAVAAGDEPLRRPLFRRRPAVLLAPLAAAVAAVGLLAAVVGREKALPSAVRVSAVWTLPASRAPLAAAPQDPAQLDVSYHGIVFPNFHDREGWHPIGIRQDRIDGVATVTVFYTTGDRHAAYTVVPTTGLAVPPGAIRLRVGGLSLQEFRSGDRWIVTFERAGNTCVLAAAAPRERAWLVRLAAWHGGPGTRPA